jgi:hypothetical protein
MLDQWVIEEIKRRERERERRNGSTGARLFCTGENGEIERRGGTREELERRRGSGVQSFISRPSKYFFDYLSKKKKNNDAKTFQSFLRSSLRRAGGLESTNSSWVDSLSTKSPVCSRMP